MSEAEFNPVTGKFIRGAVYSATDQAIYLIEANHRLFKMVALPEGHAQIMRVSGADFLHQSKIVAISEQSQVKHVGKAGDKTYKFTSRTFNVLTSEGACKIVLASARDTDVLSFGYLEHVGYPPDDAKRLEDMEND